MESREQATEPTTAVDLVDLRRCMRPTCGRPVKYATGSLCEDCSATYWNRYHGRDQSVDTLNATH
jgi:hypothetical protein